MLLCATVALYAQLDDGDFHRGVAQVDENGSFASAAQLELLQISTLFIRGMNCISHGSERVKLSKGISRAETNMRCLSNACLKLTLYVGVN